MFIELNRAIAASLAGTSPRAFGNADSDKSSPEAKNSNPIEPARTARRSQLLGENPVPALLALITAFAFAAACMLNLGYVAPWDSSALFIFTPGDYVSLGIPTTLMIVIALSVLFAVFAVLIVLNIFLITFLNATLVTAIEYMSPDSNSKKERASSKKSDQEKENYQKNKYGAKQILDERISAAIRDASGNPFSKIFYIYWLVLGILFGLFLLLISYNWLGEFFLEKTDNIYRVAVYSAGLLTSGFLSVAAFGLVGWVCYQDYLYFRWQKRGKKRAMYLIENNSSDDDEVETIIQIITHYYIVRFNGRTNRMMRTILLVAPIITILSVTFAALPSGYSLFQAQWSRVLAADEKNCVNAIRSENSLRDTCLLRPIERGVLIAEPESSEIIYVHADRDLIVTYSGPKEIPEVWRDVQALDPFVNTAIIQSAIKMAEKRAEKREERKSKNPSKED